MPELPPLPPPSKAWATGRRKSAVARVRIKLGGGSIVVNGKTPIDYFCRDVLRIHVERPLEVTECMTRYDIIADIKGGGLPPGTAGELLVRGYAVMQGYYKKPAETAETIDADGWLHTGDVATLREDGYMRFFGRYKDMLKVGGENVDPMEVEAFLQDHPAIARAQVVGVPDPRLSEVPCACIVLEPGDTVTVGDLGAFCRGKLAGFKIPRHLLILDEYPMTSSGKVQKFRLRELALEALHLPVA